MHQNLNVYFSICLINQTQPNTPFLELYEYFLSWLLELSYAPIYLEPKVFG